MYKKDEIKSLIDHATEAATVSIRNLQNSFRTADSKSNTRLIEEALGCVEIVTKSVLIPRENLLRNFFENILGLDLIAESIIHQVLQSNTPESWIMLCTLNASVFGATGYS